jgi:hypothetical protein
MSKIALTPNVSGSGVFTIASPNSKTDRTLTLPDEAGTVLTSASTTVLPKGVPAFRVYLNANQSITAASTTAVTLDSVIYDTHSFFDTTTDYKFQPTIAGYYFIHGSVYFSYTTGVGNTTWTRIYKNDTDEIFHQTLRGFNHYGSNSAAGIVYLNGSTDFVRLYGFYSGATSPVFVGGEPATYMSGYLVRAD